MLIGYVFKLVNKIPIKTRAVLNHFKYVLIKLILWSNVIDQRTRVHQITLNRANIRATDSQESQDFMRFAAAWATLPVNRLPEAVRNTCSPAAVRRQPASAV